MRWRLPGWTLGLALVIAPCSEQQVITVYSDAPAGTDAAVGSDGRAENDGGEGGNGSDAAPTTCPADNDGVITAAELPTVIGARSTWLSNAPGTTVDVDAEAEGSGDAKTWDFAAGPTDHVAASEVASPEGAWWHAEHFPTATAAVPLQPGVSDLLNVLRAETDRVLLLGVASAADGPSRTLLVYEVPLVFFELPLRLGRMWSQSVRFTDARISGVPNAGEETWRFEVDARGTLKLPDFDLPNTLRLRIEIAQSWVVSSGPSPLRSVQLVWLHECLGEVMRISSVPGDGDPAFTTASEIRRLGIGR